MKFLLIFLTTTVFLFANIYSDNNIAKELRNASVKYNIDSKVLYTLAKIESNFNPFIISFTTTKPKDYNFLNLKKNIAKYNGKKYIVTFSTNDKSGLSDLKFALRELIKLNIKVDVGLMQINSVNFKDDEIDNIFKPRFNIKKSISILKYCIGLKQKTKKAIECYNKGNRKIKNYDYYARFLRSYLRDFSSI